MVPRVTLRAADGRACEMAVYSGPPTQMAGSGEITHTVIILETPGEPEQVQRWQT